MRRVVVTGIGIVSSIGNNKEEVLNNLLGGKSGITYSNEFADANMQSKICGSINLNIKDNVDRRLLRFMNDQSCYAYVSMKEAIADAGLTDDLVSNVRTGIICGSGDASSANKIEAYNFMVQKGIDRVKPFYVPRTMGSTCSSNLAIPFKIKGVNYSISSACATSAHCIGSAYEQIQFGKQDIVFTGGGEEIHWTSAALFDIMHALSSNYNNTPEKASRPYDKNRDGFVISGGAGILVLEEYNHAINRGAKIYGEVVGYGATSDGFDMFVPSGEGGKRCMEMAIGEEKLKIDYINTHGTSTPTGDIKELESIKDLFVNEMKVEEPFISSTKALTGHSIGAAGVHEAIYSLLMLNNDFICPSMNIVEMDENAKDSNIVTTHKKIKLNRVMSNSFGFGGTNASLVFEKK
jgi:3-oxoacyl-[acyl-carrier-protein] synthase I